MTSFFFQRVEGELWM